MICNLAKCCEETAQTIISRSLIGLEHYVVEERNADVLALVVVEACSDVYNLQSLHNADKLGTEMQDCTVSVDSSPGFTSEPQSASQHLFAKRISFSSWN